MQIWPGLLRAREGQLISRPPLALRSPGAESRPRPRAPRLRPPGIGRSHPRAGPANRRGPR
jgi:hypothetical protein